MNDSKTSEHAPPKSPRPTWQLALLVFLSLIGVYVLGAYVVAPMIWVSYAHRHPALDAAPTITETHSDIPGDPLNVALIGSEDDVKQIMHAAKWFAADKLSLKADVRIADDTVLKRPYDTAPVSSLYLFGRKQDLAFEQPVGGNPSQRHHVRFWKAKQSDDQGRPLWFGSASYDKQVGLSKTTGQITHHISGDVDAERDHVLETLKETGDLTVEYVDDFQPKRTGRNGGGDEWKTDGRLGVGTITISSAPKKE
ncbi:LssY C-terminal domain-containing protein [Anatilimnocola floriformis]|uniref:LssY C-terminal domain-containing protein n=1 Tax=Anatilimnocola floriformis TaxID=2948575 RepID=UPI0020C59F12|nr:LssY C-terminal domain-containing protein [Anatilimnocola floriformis]